MTESNALADHVRLERCCAESPWGMVTTQHWLATQAGVSMLARGGNALDAAVAAAFTLGVVEPAASGLGGQTFATIFLMDGHRIVCLDGSSRAPNRTPPGAATDALAWTERLRGHRATTVPSTPAVLAYLLERYGCLGEAEILAPAIRCAREGYPISALQHALLVRELDTLQAHNAGQTFLHADGTPYSEGECFRQPRLAETLASMASEGIASFYTGKIAQCIATDMHANGGLIREDDLAQIPWPIERPPLTGAFGTDLIHTLGPPGAGRALIEALHLVDAFPECRDPDTAAGAAVLAHILRRALTDRQATPQDPALFPQENEHTEDISDPAYAMRVAERMRRRLGGRGDTTHLSVMDRHGNAIALTQSIERVFGAFTLTPSLGFLYNNYMSAFKRDTPSHPFYLRPNATPWASVAPTLVMRDQRPWLAIGSPGSERIVAAIVQVLLRLRLGWSPLAAVAAPRLHCSATGLVSLEAPRMDPGICDELRRNGFNVRALDAWAFYLGSVQLVARGDHGLIGVADPRRDGSAGGPAR